MKQKTLYSLYQTLCVTCCIGLLTACSPLTKALQANSQGDGGYPPAPALDRSLADDPPNITLSQYQLPSERHLHNDVAIAVAASGGGYRAANLTLGVLLGLENTSAGELGGNLLQNVDYFSSASGGGFGVGYYISRLKNYRQQHGSTNGFNLSKSLQEPGISGAGALRKDYSGMMFFGAHRTRNLINQLNTNVLYSPQPDDYLKLGDMYINKTDTTHKPYLPIWSPNSTIYQNGAIFPFSPDIIQRYQARTYEFAGKEHQIAGQPNNPNYGMEVPVAVGMTASASLPFALTPVRMQSSGCDKTCYLQLSDGGVSDNLGVITAVNMLRQDPRPYKVLIVIDAYKANREPFSKYRNPAHGPKVLWWALNMVSDSFRQNIKPNIPLVTRSVLCSQGANNVFVIYLDIDNIPQARAVGTALNITPEHQQLLFDIGRQMVEKNPVIHQELSQFLRGNHTIAQCRRTA